MKRGYAVLPPPERHARARDEAYYTLRDHRIRPLVLKFLGGRLSRETLPAPARDWLAARGL